MNIQHREARIVGAGTVVGRVAEIWRYPVQSMQGERLPYCLIDAAGVPGDREYGVVDPEIGEVVSAAQGKRRWRGLVTLSARLLSDPAAGERPAVEMATLDGQKLRGDQPDIDARLSAILERPVHLAHRASENKRSSYTHAPLHILTTATLAAFRTQHVSGQFTPARFRPNVVIDTGDAGGFLEQGWMERRLQIGEAARIAVTDNCDRCVMTTLPQGDLPFDPAILHTVTAMNRTWAGAYAGVQMPGPIRVGDPVVLLEG
jgi:uncharacterized protein YcbX